MTQLKLQTNRPHEATFVEVTQVNTNYTFLVGCIIKLKSFWLELIKLCYIISIKLRFLETSLWYKNWLNYCFSITIVKKTIFWAVHTKKLNTFMGLSWLEEICNSKYHFLQILLHEFYIEKYNKFSFNSKLLCFGD